MLSDRVINAVSGMAKDLVDKGVVLSPSAGTPLYELVSVAMPASIKVSDENSPPPEDQLKTATNANNLDGSPIYGDKLGEYVDLVSTAVSTTVDIARNTINPLITQFTDKVEENMKHELESAKGIDIIQVFVPKIYKNSALDELTSRYNKSGYITVEWPENAWPALEGSYLCDQLKAPVQRLKGDMKEVSDHVDERVAIAFYDYLFRNRAMDADLEDASEYYIPLFGFILSTQWEKNFPEGVSLSGDELTSKLVEFKAECGYKIQSIIAGHERKLTQGLFIKKVPTSPYRDKSIVVQGEIYNKWLEKDGTPELLIGAVLLGTRPGFEISDSERKTYIRAYENDREMNQIKVNSSRESIVTITAKKFVSDYIEDEPNIDYGLVKTRLSDFIKKHPYRSSMCQNKWFRMLLCKTVYPDSNALQILEGIDSIMSGTGKTNTREAATLSTLDLMADWLYDSMDITSGHI